MLNECRRAGEAGVKPAQDHFDQGEQRQRRQGQHHKKIFAVAQDAPPAGHRMGSGSGRESFGRCHAHVLVAAAGEPLPRESREKTFITSCLPRRDTP